MDRFKNAEILRPNFLYGRKAKIISKGYWTLTEFSGKIGISMPIISRVVSGLEFPGATHQKKIAGALGLTLRELGELLNPDRQAE